MNLGLPPLLTAGQPRYLVLAQALMDDIKSGRYPVGSLLPTEHELCQHFNVSRHTVREAIRKLSEMGLLTRQQGVGTRVKATHVASRYVQSSEGLSDLHQYVRDVRLDISGVRDVSTDEELAELLECKAGQDWLEVSGLRYMEGDLEPIALTRVYIARAYRGIADELDGQQPIYSLIERKYSVQFVEMRQSLSAVTINEKEAAALKVVAGSPGLQIVHKYTTGNGELLEVAVNLHPGDRFSYSTTQRLTWQGKDA